MSGWTSGSPGVTAGVSKERIKESLPAGRGIAERGRFRRQLLEAGTAEETLSMALLDGLHIVQLGAGLGAAVCGRLLADLGADVVCLGADVTTPLAAYLNHGKSSIAAAAAAAVCGAADIVVCEGGPR